MRTNATNPKCKAGSAYEEAKVTNTQRWVWTESAVGKCELCDDTVAGSAWVQYTQPDGFEKATKLICFICNRNDLNCWRAERRDSQQRNASVAAPPVPQANMSTPQPAKASVSTEPPKALTIPATGVTVVKQVLRDAKTGLISGVQETTYSATDARKRKIEQRTPEQWEKAIHSYEKWKRAGSRKSRGRQ